MSAATRVSGSVSAAFWPSNGIESSKSDFWRPVNALAGRKEP
jgi:hypothetical protein